MFACHHPVTNQSSRASANATSTPPSGSAICAALPVETSGTAEPVGEGSVSVAVAEAPEDDDIRAGDVGFAVAETSSPLSSSSVVVVVAVVEVDFAALTSTAIVVDTASRPSPNFFSVGSAACGFGNTSWRSRQRLIFPGAVSHSSYWPSQHQALSHRGRVRRGEEVGRGGVTHWRRRLCTASFLRRIATRSPSTRRLAPAAASAVVRAEGGGGGGCFTAGGTAPQHGIHGFGSVHTSAVGISRTALVRQSAWDRTVRWDEGKRTGPVESAGAALEVTAGRERVLDGLLLAADDGELEQHRGGRGHERVGLGVHCCV